eukprot:5845313-Pyramimonas_sp.AAC.1
MDCWAPRLLGSLPRAAVGVYADLLNQCESLMMRPTQVMLGLVALLPKAADAERPVCMFPTLHQIYCKASGRDIDDWNVQRPNFWDTAIRGPSALQAALLRD